MNSRDPLDEVEFLARSRHRVRVLETLAASPHTRRDIHETLDLSRATLGRVLGNFEERGWVRREGQEYHLTPLGRLLAEEFVSLLETVALTQDLGAVMEWLPVEAMDFGLERFAGATITTPTMSDSIAPVRRAGWMIRGSDWVRALVRAATPITAEAYRDVTVGGASVAVVLSASAVETVLADPEMRRLYEELTRSEEGAVFRYDGDVPYILGLVGAAGTERAGIGLVDDTGAPRGYVDTDDDAVRSWVADVVDRYRNESERLDPEVFEE